MQFDFRPRGLIPYPDSLVLLPDPLRFDVRFRSRNRLDHTQDGQQVGGGLECHRDFEGAAWLFDWRKVVGTFCAGKSQGQIQRGVR